MSIRAMTWAFSLPLEPRAKIALLAIADNARDDGVAWPSRDLIAEKSTQSRATINRRLKILSELGVLRLVERYREDGSQTTDEIRLDLALSPDEVMRRMQGLSADDRGEEADETANCDSGPEASEGGEGGCQADTPPVQSGYPGDAVVTPRGLHSGHPLVNHHLNQESPPTPSGGVRVDDGPLKKPDKEAIEKRSTLWDRFIASYPLVGLNDQQAARDEFEKLSVDDAEWAVGSIAPLKGDLKKAKDRPPKGAHLWLRKGMFKNYPKLKLDAPAPEEVWIVEGSDEDRALRFVRSLAKQPNRFVRTLADGARGYPHKVAVGPDMLAMLAFVNDVTLAWPAYANGTPSCEAWQTRFQQWIGARVPPQLGLDGIRAPGPWPPKKDGTIYRDDEEPVDEANSEGSAS